MILRLSVTEKTGAGKANEGQRPLARPRGLHCRLPRRRRSRSHRHHAGDRRLVQDDRETILESARLRLWPRLDHSLRDDGSRSLVGVETGRVQGRSSAAVAVRCTTRLERRLVVHLLRPAPARLGVRGDRDPVAGDRGDDGRVLSLLKGRRLADDAVPGLGQLRQRAELRDLEVERSLTASTDKTHQIQGFRE